MRRRTPVHPRVPKSKNRFRNPGAPPWKAPIARRDPAIDRSELAPLAFIVVAAGIATEKALVRAQAPAADGAVTVVGGDTAADFLFGVKSLGNAAHFFFETLGWTWW
jgi:hypothetical protein